MKTVFRRTLLKTLTLGGWEKTARSPFAVRPVYFQCKMVYTQHVKRFELPTFRVWLCIKEESFKKSESEYVLMSSWSWAHHLFTPWRFTDPSFKASKTNTRVSYTLRRGGNEAPLSSTASASLSLSVRVNIVARRGWGGSGRGDVWSRQTEAAWVKQTETKPAVRGSDSGGGEGARTSEQHCVGDGNCGLAGPLPLQDLAVAVWRFQVVAVFFLSCSDQPGSHHIKATSEQIVSWEL